MEKSRRIVLSNRDLWKNQYACDEPFVSIIIASCRPNNIEKIVRNIACQKYKNKEVIIITQGYSENEIAVLKKRCKLLDGFVNVRVFEGDSSLVLGERLNSAIDLSQGEYWAKMDDDDLYFENYLSDMMILFKITQCDIVGKASQFVYLESSNQLLIRRSNLNFVQTDQVSGATLVVKKSNELVRFGELNKGEDTKLLEYAKQAGLMIYANAPFNHVLWRSGSVENHTWQVDADYFLENSQVVSSGFVSELCTF